MYIFVLFSKRLLLFQSTGFVKASLDLARLGFASVKVKSGAVQAVLVFIVRIGAALFQCAKAIKRRVRGERGMCVGRLTLTECKQSPFRQCAHRPLGRDRPFYIGQTLH